MNMKERARSLRAGGTSMREISDSLKISLAYAYKCAGDILLSPIEETDSTVIRYHAHNGGCSSASGMRPISMPRITALHGAMA